MIWTAEADALLIDRWQAGCSMTEVAKALRAAGYPIRDRNPVAGRMWRLKQKGLTFAERPTVLRPRKPIIVHTRKLIPTLKVRPMPRPKPEKRKPANGGVEYMDLCEAHCKALLDKRGRDGLSLSCGKARVEIDGSRTPYCLDHFSLYYNPQYVRRIIHGEIS